MALHVIDELFIISDNLNSEEIYDKRNLVGDNSKEKKSIVGTDQRTLYGIGLHRA